jgi:hypothetical protein
MINASFVGRPIDRLVHMLTPMLVQYLVGLCCVRANPAAVDVTVGDLVLDEASKKRRDVDITVTVREDSADARAFKAYEVKRERQPLDVDTVEQLCAKLHDMPSVTHRAIVSASGFTDGAIAKAIAHDVELYVMQAWDSPLAEEFPEFKGVGPPSEFLRQWHTMLLYWRGAQLDFIVPDGPPSFTCEWSTPLFASNGSPHKEFPSVRKYADALLYGTSYYLDAALALALLSFVSTLAAARFYAEGSPF